MKAMYHEDLAPLIAWVEDGMIGVPPEPFWSWLRNHMPPNCRARIEHKLGIITPNSPRNGEWVKGYPHIHSATMGWKPEVFTIITYLIVPESGGEFMMGGANVDDPYEVIKVKPGLSVGTDSVTWHGVLPVHEGRRVALITNGFPE